MSKTSTIQSRSDSAGLTHCFNSVAIANLDALVLMRDGKSQECAQLLEKSLSNLEEALEGLNSSQLQSTLKMPLLQPVYMKLRHRGNNDKSFFLCSEAFTFVPNPQEVQITIESLQEILYCTLLYNLGLCLHLRAFQEDSPRSTTKLTSSLSNVRDIEETLDEARMAYESALIDFDCWQEQPQLLRSMELAVNNNLAHINIHFQRRQEANTDILRMSALLTDGCKSLPKSIASLFVHNVYHNCTIAYRPAPAA